MDLELIPRPLSGAVTPPPSKSQTLRLILCAALADVESGLHNIYPSDDVRAAIRCAETLGARAEADGDSLRIRGCGGRYHGGRPCFDCGESASVLRFLIPVSLALCGGGTFTGQGRLMERPLWPFRNLFTEKGIEWRQEDGVLTVSGGLPAGEYRLPGDVSSQFFSGLLLALPLTEGASELCASTMIESADYVGMTLDALTIAGVQIEETGGRWQIQPQRYHCFESNIEADWSQAAFWIAARTLGNPVDLDGLSAASRQGDRRIAAFAELLAAPGDLTIDVAQCPDLVPPLAVMAALREGSCRIGGAARLRHKESDRLTSVTAALRALGAEIREEPEALVLRGVPALQGGAVDCCGDHRIAMMAAVAAARCRGPVRLHGADCVKKSYPDFWDVYQSLGGECHVLQPRR